MRLETCPFQDVLPAHKTRYSLLGHFLLELAGRGTHPQLPAARLAEHPVALPNPVSWKKSSGVVVWDFNPDNKEEKKTREGINDESPTFPPQCVSCKRGDGKAEKKTGKQQAETGQGPGWVER